MHLVLAAAAAGCWWRALERPLVAFTASDAASDAPVVGALVSEVELAVPLAEVAQALVWGGIAALTVGAIAVAVGFRPLLGLLAQAVATALSSVVVVRTLLLVREGPGSVVGAGDGWLFDLGARAARALDALGALEVTSGSAAGWLGAGAACAAASTVSGAMATRQRRRAAPTV